MKIIRLSLHCYQILPIFPSYRMMFLSHLQVDQGIINATMNPVIPTHIPDPAVASPMTQLLQCAEELFECV